MNINKITFFDTETTGLDLNKDGLVSIYCENKKANWYLNTMTNPEIEISEESIAVHGITNEMVKDKPTNKEVLKSLVKIFNDTKIIGGYNILKFDLPIVINLCKSYNIDIDFKNYQYVDVYYLLKIVLSDEDQAKIGSLKLTNVYKYITNRTLKNAHDAEVDIRGTKRILKWILENYDVDDCLFLNHEYISGIPVSENYTFFTGKRTGYSVKELIAGDPRYLKWLQSKKLISFDDTVNDF
jgi:DNA polymerase III subunit epsilon